MQKPSPDADFIDFTPTNDNEEEQKNLFSFFGMSISNGMNKGFHPLSINFSTKFTMK